MRFKGWIRLFIALVIINSLLCFFARSWRFDSILIHHSAGASGDLAAIRAMHLQRGWSDAAYHLIFSNGSTKTPAGYLEASSHFKTLDISGATRDTVANRRCLQLCLVGNYETDPFPQTLRPALAHALKALCTEFSIPQEKIVFHRDVNNTICPGKYLVKKDIFHWINTLAEKCPQAIKQQQNKVIAGSSISLQGYPISLLTLQASVSFVFCVIWFGLFRLFRAKRTYRKATSSTGIKKTKHPRKNRHKK